jgi:hypothetical protein
MKWSNISIGALLCLALAGPVYAQSLGQPTTAHNATIRLVSASAVTASQSTADNAMSMEEIARRLVRKRWEQSPVPQKYPIRLTIASVQVSSQDADSYIVKAKYTIREYRSTLTHVIDYDSTFTLVKEADRWRLRGMQGGNIHSDGRYDAQATPPPAGETDVPAPSATVATQSAAATTAPAASTSQSTADGTSGNEQMKQLTYKVGQRVEYVYNGKWYKAIIVALRDDSADHVLSGRKLYSPYRVHPLGYETTMDTWVCCADNADHRTQLRPAGSGPTEPVPGGEANDPVLKAARGSTAAQPNQNRQAGSNKGGSAVPLGEYNCVAMARQVGGGELIHVGGFTLQAGGAYEDEDNGRGTFTYDSGKHEITFRGAAMDGQVGRYDAATATFTLKSAHNSVDCDQ